MASQHEDLRTTLRMRCGKTGAVTLAVFTRTGTSEKFRIEEVLESTSDGQQLALQGAGQNTDCYASDQFDWSGWYCPCCGHYQDGKGLHRFVRCGGCRELVCGFSIREVFSMMMEVGPGISTFKCFCGAGGRISATPIDSYDGQAAAKTNALAAAASFKALLPPKRS